MQTAQPTSILATRAHRSKLLRPRFPHNSVGFNKIEIYIMDLNPTMSDCYQNRITQIEARLIDQLDRRVISKIPKKLTNNLPEYQHLHRSEISNDGRNYYVVASLAATLEKEETINPTQNLDPTEERIVFLNQVRCTMKYIKEHKHLGKEFNLDDKSVDQIARASVRCMNRLFRQETIDPYMINAALCKLIDLYVQRFKYVGEGFAPDSVSKLNWCSHEMRI